MKRLLLATALVIMMACTCAVAEEVAVAGGDETAVATQTYTFHYGRTQETVLNQKLSADIDNIVVAENPMGIYGQMSSTVKYTGALMNEATRMFPMALDLDEMQQRFDGQVMPGPEKATLRVSVTAKGELDKKHLEGVDASIMSASGLPTPLLALLCHWVRFPSAPVAVGQTWETEDNLPMGEDGDQITIFARTKLAKVVDDREYWTVSEVEVDLPMFEVPNPLGYGEDVPVSNGHIKIAEFWQIFDTERSVVTKAEGAAQFKGEVDYGGFPMALSVDTKFTLKPAPVLATPEVAATETGAATTTVPTVADETNTETR